MPLQLIPPGRRIKYRAGKAYANTTYLVRGEIDGREREISTKTRDPIAASRFKAEIELRILDSRVPGPAAEVTFAKAAALYIAFRDPTKSDRTRIARIVEILGDRPVRAIQQADLVDAANRLYPAHKNETKNRGAIKPAAAILHYAARNSWCSWLRIEKFEEGPLVTRATTTEAAKALLAATTGKKHLLLLWLLRHYNRISDPLRLSWEQIDLQRKTYLLYIGKTRTWKVKPLNEEVFEALANEARKEGWLFPWRTRSGVYKWLRPLCRKLRVSFTPHMARHYGGKQLNAAGAGLKTIMGALDHSDPQSSVRYQDADLDIVRAAINATAKLSGKLPGKTGDKRGKPGAAAPLRRQRS